MQEGLQVARGLKRRLRSGESGFRTAGHELIQPYGDSGGAGRAVLRERVRRKRGLLGELQLQHDPAGLDAVPMAEFDSVLHSGAIQERAVLAAQIPQAPPCSGAFEREVPPGEVRLIGETERIVESPPYRDNVVNKSMSGRSAVGFPDEELGAILHGIPPCRRWACDSDERGRRVRRG